MFGILSLFEINEVPAIGSCQHQVFTNIVEHFSPFTEETIQNWKNGKDSNKDEAGDENRTGKVCINVMNFKYHLFLRWKFLTFSTVGGGQDEEHQPEPEADVEVEGVDGGDGDAGEEGDEVAEGL